MDFECKANYTFSDLLEIMNVLRQQCPWDREQTHASIRKNVIEEAYEVADAIDRNDHEALCEELGDLLLQVVFHSRIALESNEFTMDDVSDRICKKLILRHPHIFSNIKADSADEVLDNWDEIKKSEKGFTKGSQTLDSVPISLPALMRSQKIQKRAAKTGLDYESALAALDGLEKEISELKEAMASNNKAAQDCEMGDVLFSAVNVSRLLKIDAEESLTRSCNKFLMRYRRLEDKASVYNLDIKKATSKQLDDLWNQVKGMESTKITK
jgi:tetrapyrrole methylase family protein/MazG family protein